MRNLNSMPSMLARWTGMLLLAALTALPAVAQPKPGPAPRYVLQPGDEITLTVLPRTEYSVSGAIPPDGILQLKNIGGVQAAGLTLPQLEDRAQQALAKVLRSPRVTVSLVRLAGPAQAGVVTIRGQVVKPGSFPMQPKWTLEDLVAAAGSVTPIADLAHVELHRGESKRVIDLDARQRQAAPEKIALEAGDEVVIPRHEQIVLLIGAIPNPGPRALKPGQRVKDFFTSEQPETLASLDGSRVALDKVQIIRKGQNAKKISLKSVLTRKEHKDNLALQHGDIVFLPARDDPRRSPLDYLRALPLVGTLIGLF